MSDVASTPACGNRSLEILADNKERIETHLFENTKRIRGTMDIIFYDVTTFALQSVEQDALRDFGFSKDQKFLYSAYFRH